jgi:hypothetical protein
MSDEHLHFMIARQARDVPLRPVSEEVEQQIVASMVSHDWWRHRDRETPSVLPANFNQAGLALSRYVYSGPITYYVAAGWLTEFFPESSLLPQFYAMRLLSLAAGLATLWCAWAATSALLGTRGAAVVTTLIALHPEFLIVSTSANPDALVNLSGAALWWQAVWLFRGGTPAKSISLMWASAFAAALMKRLGIALMGHAAIISLLYLLFAKAVRQRVQGLAALLLIAVCAAAVAVVASDEAQRVVLKATIDLDRMLTFRAGEWGYFVRFSIALFKSAWLNVGWLPYLAPTLWYAVVAAVLLLAVAGLPRAFRGAGWRTMLFSAAALMILVQTVLVYAQFYPLEIPHGRYLFPLLVPFTTFVWIGIRSLVSAPMQPYAAAALVMVAAALDMAGWALVMIPAYVV